MVQVPLSSTIHLRLPYYVPLSSISIHPITYPYPPPSTSAYPIMYPYLPSLFTLLHTLILHHPPPLTLLCTLIFHLYSPYYIPLSSTIHLRLPYYVPLSSISIHPITYPYPPPSTSVHLSMYPYPPQSTSPPLCPHLRSYPTPVLTSVHLPISTSVHLIIYLYPPPSTSLLTRFPSMHYVPLSPTLNDPFTHKHSHPHRLRTLFHPSVQWWAGSHPSATSGDWGLRSTVSRDYLTRSSITTFSTMAPVDTACSIVWATAWCCYYTGCRTSLCLGSPTSHQRKITVSVSRSSTNHLSGSQRVMGCLLSI